MDVAVFVTINPAAPSMVTELAPVKFVPVIVNDWPPARGPALPFDRPVIVGAATYVNAVEEIDPYGVVITTETSPAA
jgi:hypothetical protein